MDEELSNLKSAIETSMAKLGVVPHIVHVRKLANAFLVLATFSVDGEEWVAGAKGWDLGDLLEFLRRKVILAMSRTRTGRS
jgi:hypothetical protein